MKHFRFQISNFKLSSGQTAVTAILLVVLLCGGCRRAKPAEAAAEGQMRIVSMAPNLTEILFALGLDEEIVGVTQHCNTPEQARQKRRIGTFWQPDIEAVLAIRPTLVIAEGFEQQRQLAEQLNAVGCKTLTADIETIEQLYAAILAIGEAVNRIEQAQSLVTQMIETQERLCARYADRPRCKVLWVIQREPLRVAGTKTFVNEMIEAVGGVNAVGPTLNVYPPISAEQVFAARPDVIIEPTDTPEHWDEQAVSAMRFYAAFKSIPAVQNSRIYVLDGDLVSRLGPRLNQGLEQIAGCLWQD
jgi:iron complex transport system substrate-binding protein